MRLKELLTKLKDIWDIRPRLAREWLDSAQKYEERLRANKLVNPLLIDSILQERERIHTLFKKLLPEFQEQISVVITGESQVEHCAIFSWNKHIYILVSAPLIARPIDYPESSEVMAWEWLARHEISHLRSGHLPWLFHVRRFFQFTILSLCISKLFFYLFPGNYVIDAWLNISFWLFLGGWCLQMMINLAFEYKADLDATRSTNDCLVLEEAEKAIHRMNTQAMKRLSQPFGWLNYLLCSLFFDPHPPFILRCWLLRKHSRSLRKGLIEPAITTIKH